MDFCRPAQASSHRRRGVPLLGGLWLASTQSELTRAPTIVSLPPKAGVWSEQGQGVSPTIRGRSAGHMPTFAPVADARVSSVCLGEGSPTTRVPRGCDPQTYQRGRLPTARQWGILLTGSPEPRREPLRRRSSLPFPASFRWHFYQLAFHGSLLRAAPDPSVCLSNLFHPHQERWQS